MIKKTSIISLFVYIVIILFLGYPYLFGKNFITNSMYTIYALTVIISIFIAIPIYLKTYRKKRDSEYYIINKVIPVYFFIVIAELIYTEIKYHYSIIELVQVAIPFLMIFFTYPLIYISINEKKLKVFSKRIIVIVLLMVLIKTVSSVLYSFWGFDLFHELLFMYGDWTRNGIQRVSVGPIFCVGIFFVLQRQYKSNMLKYLLIALMWLYVLLIAQSRYLAIILLFDLMLYFYLSGESSKKRLIRFCITIIAVVGFILSGFVRQIIESFSLSGQFSGSTEARLLTVYHYFDLYVHGNLLLGLGLLNEYNSVTLRIMERFQGILYYFSDIGILSTFFQMGMLGVFLVSDLLYKIIVIPRKIIDKKQRVIYSCVIMHIILSCLIMNFYDYERCVDLPFYILIISKLCSQNNQEGII